MASRRVSKPVEVVNDTGDDLDAPVDVVPVDPPENAPGPGQPQDADPVLRLTGVVTRLYDEIRSLEQRVADLETLVSQPVGAVEFYAPAKTGTPDIAWHGLPDDIPDYVPRVHSESGDYGDSTPWF